MGVCLPKTVPFQSEIDEEEDFDPNTADNPEPTSEREKIQYTDTNVFKCNKCPREFLHLRGFKKHKLECIDDTIHTYECPFQVLSCAKQQRNRPTL